jgi:hypothetical protein
VTPAAAATTAATAASPPAPPPGGSTTSSNYTATGRYTRASGDGRPLRAADHRHRL